VTGYLKFQSAHEWPVPWHGLVVAVGRTGHLCHRTSLLLDIHVWVYVKNMTYGHKVNKRGTISSTFRCRGTTFICMRFILPWISNIHTSVTVENVVLWLGRLVAGLSQRRPRSVHVECVAHRVALAQISTDFFGFAPPYHSTVAIHTHVLPG
jgi:hypothetical protein